MGRTHSGTNQTLLCVLAVLSGIGLLDWAVQITTNHQAKLVHSALSFVFGGPQ